MKKLGVLVMALVFILSASVYSFADERVEFNGQYRAAAWMIQNNDFNDDDDRYFWDQRFRLPVTFNISEAVSAHLRFDFAEGTWGEDFYDLQGWSSPIGLGDRIQVDRAFVQISQDMYTLQVGEHFNGVGNYIVWDQISTGITLSLDLPVNVTLNYSKVSEGNNATAWNLTDDEDYDSEDKDFYAINLGYDQDNWNLNALFAMEKDYSDRDQSPYAIGVYGAIALDMLTFSGEIDMLGGDNGNNDYKGLQGFFDAAFDMNDMFKVGGTFLYAKGYDDDDETQITAVRAADGIYDPLGFGGVLNTRYYPVGPQGRFGGVFDPSGAGAGLIGGRLYADAAFSDKLNAYVRLGYLTPQDDDMTLWDSAFTGFGNVDYQWLPSTTLSAGLGAVDPSFESGYAGNDDTELVGITQITVNW